MRQKDNNGDEQKTRNTVVKYPPSSYVPSHMADFHELKS